MLWVYFASQSNHIIELSRFLSNSREPFTRRRRRRRRPGC